MGNICGGGDSPPPNPVQIDLSHFELLKVVGKGGFGKVNAIQRKTSQELFALKRMAKCEVIKKESHIRMIWVERNIMAKLNSPFLCSIEHAFQSDTELFFVMPFMQGGDLRFHMSKRPFFTEREVCFYAAEMVLGLESMHNAKVVYRDLKPDNILLDADGHIRLSDFGLSVELEEKNGYKIKGNAGTSGYLAPEVAAGEYYGVEPDIWSFGVTLFELLHGRRPWRQFSPQMMGKLKFGEKISPAARSLIKACLQIEPSARIGCGPTGWEEVKKHAFFRKIDWDQVARKAYDPPIHPDLEHANCNNQADLADQLIDKKPEPISPEMQKHFEGFEFNVDIATMPLVSKIRYGLVDFNSLTDEEKKSLEEIPAVQLTEETRRKIQNLVHGKPSSLNLVPFPTQYGSPCNDGIELVRTGSERIDNANGEASVSNNNNNNNPNNNPEEDVNSPNAYDSNRVDDEQPSDSGDIVLEYNNNNNNRPSSGRILVAAKDKSS